VFFLYDDKTGEIEACHVVGTGSTHVEGLRIPLGQRLSGWVAANRQTIVNSDPVLDLGDIARHHVPQRLRSCLSAPLVTGDDLVGVISLYSHETSAFSEDHRRIIEAVALQAAAALHRSSTADVRNRDQAGLPGIEQLDRMLRSNQVSAQRSTLLLIRIINWADIDATYGSTCSDELLRRIADRTRHELEPSHGLFRGTQDELVAIVAGTKSEVAIGIARRIEVAINSGPIASSFGSIKVHILVSVVIDHDTNIPIRSLLAARSRAADGQRNPSERSIH
jgi:diguanylate cyclase (GGDEF)-like protein